MTPRWSSLTLTASNQAQANGYTLQLRARADHLASTFARTQVIPDPSGRRIGSGGSTLLVLASIVRSALASSTPPRSLEACFKGHHHLIVHSGGDARRLPAFSALGKIFVPLPAATPAGHPLSLFELITADLASVALGKEGGVLIASGDVYLNLAQHTFTLSAPGLTGVAFPGSISTATRHGVYLHKRGRLTDFLQKPSAQLLRARKALHNNRALIDSGVIALCPKTAARLLRAAGFTLAGTTLRARPHTLAAHLHSTSPPSIDLYQHLLMAPAPRISESTYLALPGITPATRPAFKRFRTTLASLPAHVHTIPTCPFIHIGTTQEWNALRAHPNQPWLQARGIPLPAELLKSFEHPGPLPKAVGLSLLPIGRAQWAAVLFGHTDDCKTPLNSGGTLLGHSLDAPLLRRLAALNVWPSTPSFHSATLWSAPLFIIGTRAETLSHAKRLLQGRLSSKPRHALADLLPKVNHARLIAARAAEWKALLAAHPRAALAAFPHLDLSLLTPPIKVPATAPLRIRTRAAIVNGTDPFAQVAHSITRAPATPTLLRARPATSFTATCPARIDLTGGWTDTPPLCQELGGAVINLAVQINGTRPLRATATALQAPAFILESLDLNQRTTIDSPAKLVAALAADSWARLPLAVLQTLNLIPAQSRAAARRWPTLTRGLHLQLHSSLPAGSGLGASSILGAAALAATAAVLGRPLAPPALIARTLELEQHMTTGGGWQDQVGGILPGAKLITSSPGEQQRPIAAPLPTQVFETPHARARCLLIFTGRRRLARNILRGVVTNYLTGDPSVVAAAHALHASIPPMARAIQNEDLDALADSLTHYWHLKKQMDPGSTNPFIERLIETIRPFASGWSLTGAGGGGFLFVIARSASAARQLTSTLATQASPAVPVPFAVDHRGLVLSKAQ